MRFDIDIYDPADIRAFAVFLNTIADRAETAPKTPAGLSMGAALGAQQAALGDSDGGTARGRCDAQRVRARGAAEGRRRGRAELGRPRTDLVYERRRTSAPAPIASPPRIANHFHGPPPCEPRGAGSVNASRT